MARFLACLLLRGGEADSGGPSTISDLDVELWVGHGGSTPFFPLAIIRISICCVYVLIRASVFPSVLSFVNCQSISSDVEKFQNVG